MLNSNTGKSVNKPPMAIKINRCKHKIVYLKKCFTRHVFMASPSLENNGCNMQTSFFIKKIAHVCLKSKKNHCIKYTINKTNFVGVLIFFHQCDA